MAAYFISQTRTSAWEKIPLFIEPYLDFTGPERRKRDLAGWLAGSWVCKETLWTLLERSQLDGNIIFLCFELKGRKRLGKKKRRKEKKLFAHLKREARRPKTENSLGGPWQAEKIVFVGQRKRGRESEQMKRLRQKRIEKSHSEAS